MCCIGGRNQDTHLAWPGVVVAELQQQCRAIYRSDVASDLPCCPEQQSVVFHSTAAEMRVLLSSAGLSLVASALATTLDTEVFEIEAAACVCRCVVRVSSRDVPMLCVLGRAGSAHLLAVSGG